MKPPSSLRIHLPHRLQSRLEAALLDHLQAGRENLPPVDFAQPQGEPALTPAGSISWQVFSNPVALAIGGITAVLLELAEPRVRSGVWNHTTFRTDPLKRMRRTGMAAMVTVYGPRGAATSMIEGVRRMHEKVQGTTPAGRPYRANDPELLRWVHATATFGFLQAYHTYVRHLPPAERDLFHAESAPVAAAYGAADAPTSQAEFNVLFDRTLPHLERSEILFDFLQIMSRVRILPPPFRLLDKLLLRAAVELVPGPARELLGLGRRYGLPPGGAHIIRFAGSLADRIHLESSPATQARKRLNLPPV